jgi:hypothetical protein
MPVAAHEPLAIMTAAAAVLGVVQEIEAFVDDTVAVVVHAVADLGVTREVRDADRFRVAEAADRARIAHRSAVEAGIARLAERVPGRDGALRRHRIGSRACCIAGTAPIGRRSDAEAMIARGTRRIFAVRVLIASRVGGVVLRIELAAGQREDGEEGETVTHHSPPIGKKYRTPATISAAAPRTMSTFAAVAS